MEESGALERGRLSDKTRTVEEVQRNDEGRKTDVWCYCVFVFWNLRDAPRGFMVFISRGGASIGSSGWVRTLPSLLAAARHRPRCFHVQGCRRGRSLPLHPARNGPRQLRHQGPPPLPSPIGQCRAQDPSNGSPDPCILGAQSWMLGQFGAEMLRRLCNQTQACASSILVNSQWKSPSIRGARSCCIRVPSHEDIDQTGNFRLFGAPGPAFSWLSVSWGRQWGSIWRQGGMLQPAQCRIKDGKCHRAVLCASCNIQQHRSLQPNSTSQLPHVPLSGGLPLPIWVLNMV